MHDSREASIRCEIDLLEGWSFAECFRPLPPKRVSEAIAEASRQLCRADIAQHPFFSFARESKDAIVRWTMQEVVVTNAFSQALFALYATIRNVHIRSFLLPVLTGEHSAIK